MSPSVGSSAQPGPVYDDAMKILAADDLDAVLSLLGVPGGAQEMNTALPGSEVRADLLARTTQGIVHVEYVKDRTPNLDVRMMNYRLRMRGQDGDRHTPIAQYVLVLGDRITVPDRYDDVDVPTSMFGWSVVRLADLEPSTLLGNPTTAAVAALGRGSQGERARAFTAAAELIADTDPDRARTLLEAARTLASIVLPGPIIDTALKEATMPVLIRDTPFGREMYQQGRQEGRQEGQQEGLREGERQAVLRLTVLILRQRFGDAPRLEAIAERLAGLPDEERLRLIAAARDLADLER